MITGIALRSRRLYRTTIIALALLVVLMMTMPFQAHAANTTWSVDTNIELTGPGITLVIVAGSQSDSVVIDSAAGTVQVTVGAAETFTLRYPGPNPGDLVNDGGLVGCTYVGGNNEATVNGAQTLTFTPSTTPECVALVASSGGGGGSAAPSLSLIAPASGGTLRVGESYTVLWSAGGGSIDGLTLSYSIDDGVTYTTIVSSTYNDGNYVWLVPDVGAASAKLKIALLSTYGSVLNTVVRDVVIEGATVPEPELIEEEPTLEELEAAAPSVDPTVSGSYSPTTAAASTPTIDIDKALVVPAGEETPSCEGGTLIKGASSSAVYYCGENAKRYVFPNERIFYTWFEDFSGLVELSDSALASIPLGGNVTYKPGVRMVKIVSDPKVYTVSRGGRLRWVQNEAVAVALYGADWNTKIDDVDVAYFFSYGIGDPITEADAGL